MTAIAADFATAVRLDVGDVLRSTLQVLRRRALDLAIVGGPFVVAPAFLVGLLPDELQTPASLGTGLFGIVFTGGASLITHQELTGRARIGGWQAILRASARFGGLWGVGVISGLAIGLGTLLLVVPGMIALVSLVPASAVVVVENKLATPSIERALELTRGSRWRLAGCCATVTAVLAVLALLFFGLDIALFAAGGQRVADAGGRLISPLFSYAIVALMTVFSASAYTALRRLRGDDAVEVARVFA